MERDFTVSVTEEIRKGIKALFKTGDVVEIRAFDPAGVWRVGGEGAGSCDRIG